MIKYQSKNSTCRSKVGKEVSLLESSEKHVRCPNCHAQNRNNLSTEIREQSSQQKKLKNDAESTTDKRKRLQFKQQRNSVMRQIKQLLKMETNAKFDKELQDIER